MRRGRVLVLLLLSLILFLVMLPQRMTPVLAYRALLWANQDRGQPVQPSSLVRVSMSEGTTEERGFIRSTSEEALRILQLEFGYRVKRPVRVVVSSALGGNMGRYYLGQVEIRPASEWQSVQGPVLHELTHYVVDVMTGGNYPAWLSEGLALYMELKHEGHRWAGNGRHAGPLSYDKIDKHLADPEYYVDAYAQALGMVEYIYELRGSAGVSLLLTSLGQGHGFERAMLEAYEVTVEEFMQEWQDWQKAE